MTGKWYAVGVGPGDPELMTVKAVRILKECGTIAIPHSDRQTCTAYKIAVRAVPELDGKKCICLPMPMTRDRLVLEQSHIEAANKTEECLDKGENVAFITLGDSTVYSTALYLKERLDKKQYETELINGIPSFCAAAARLGTALVNGDEELHILPACCQLEGALKLPGMKVLMKSGRKLSNVKRLLEEYAGSVTMVENCGMENERIYERMEDIPEEAGYFSLFFVHDREGGK